MEEPIVSTSRLHEFDLQLCRLVRHHTRKMLEQGACPKIAPLLDPDLRGFVSEPESGTWWFDGPAILFGELELLHLQWAAGMVCCCYPWVSFPQILGLWYGFVPEINHTLTDQAAAEWWAFCREMEEALTAQPLVYQEGVALVQEWTRTAPPVPAGFGPARPRPLPGRDLPDARASNGGAQTRRQRPAEGNGTTDNRSAGER
jgi:hypothetical protein